MKNTVIMSPVYRPRYKKQNDEIVQEVRNLDLDLFDEGGNLPDVTIVKVNGKFKNKAYFLAADCVGRIRVEVGENLKRFRDNQGEYVEHASLNRPSRRHFYFGTEDDMLAFGS